jgi:hypothetical protein
LGTGCVPLKTIGRRSVKAIEAGPPSATASRLRKPEAVAPPRPVAAPYSMPSWVSKWLR